MPIIESTPPDEWLSQGDILQGISLFSTREGWNPDGGQAVTVDCELCLLLSRPCVAQHKRHVVVAPIVKYPKTVPRDVETLDDILKFLESIRDGEGSLDLFYLGEIPGRVGRFAARLDSFHSVQVPSDPKERGGFVQQRRIGRLHVRFVRDLHLRIFRTFASLGFDDVSWLPDADLEWVLASGRSALADAEKQLHEKEAVRSKKEFGGGTHSAADLDSAEKKLADLKAKLAPYEEEYQSRLSPKENRTAEQPGGVRPN